MAKRSKYYIRLKERTEKTRNPRWWWVLCHVNGEVLAASEMLNAKADRDDTVRRLARSHHFRVFDKDGKHLTGKW